MIILSSEGLSINNESVDFTITQPSSPITKNQQDETFDLVNHPNAIITCDLIHPLIVTSTYPASFEYDGTIYSFNAKVTNQTYFAKDGYTATLQIVGKVTAEDAPEPETTYYVKGWVNETNNDTFLPIVIQPQDYDAVVIELVPNEEAGGNSGKFFITSSNDPETWQEHCLGVDGSQFLQPQPGSKYQLTEGYQTRFEMTEPLALELVRDRLVARFV